MILLDKKKGTKISQSAKSSTRGARFDTVHLTKPDFDELASLSPVELFEWFRSVSFGFRVEQLDWSKITIADQKNIEPGEFKKQFMCEPSVIGDITKTDKVMSHLD
jgi:hypothetical protein